VCKRTPPSSVPRQDARLTKGYPALMAYTVNLPQPAMLHTPLFSSAAPDLLGEHRELARAMHTMRAVIPPCALRR